MNPQTTTLLDPWADAQEIAERLQRDQARLVIVLGAESWCAKCRALRPAFDERASRAEPQDVWLWLDLQEHDEFIGDFVPDDLPLLLIYRTGQLVHADVASVTVLDRVLQKQEEPVIVHRAPADLISRLLSENWVPKSESE